MLKFLKSIFTSSPKTYYPKGSIMLGPHNLCSQSIKILNKTHQTSKDDIVKLNVDYKQYDDFQLYDLVSTLWINHQQTGIIWIIRDISMFPGRLRYFQLSHCPTRDLRVYENEFNKLEIYYNENRN